jgi:hypothetical protein
MNDQKFFIGYDMSKRSFEVVIVSDNDPRCFKKVYNNSRGPARVYFFVKKR